MSKRINIPVILMVMAILAIIAFQGYWMYKNYQEEENTLTIRTSVLFRSVAYRLQAETLKQDTNVRVWARAAKGMPVNVASRMPETAGATPMATLEPHPADEMVVTNIPPDPNFQKIRLQERINLRGDSVPANATFIAIDSVSPERIRAIHIRKSVKSSEGEIPDSAITISMATNKEMLIKTRSPLKGSVSAITIENSIPATRAKSSGNARPGKISMNVSKDSVKDYMVLTRLMEDGTFRNLLQRVDSLKDTLSMAELNKRYRTALDKESLKVNYTIIKDSVSERQPGELIDPTRTNELLMGYASNYYLRYELHDTFRYIIRKLSPQIALSLLLIALTSFSFVLLYRNLVKQRRLTQFKNDLISNITHELKTPIATVSVAIEALKNFHAMDDPRRTEEYLDISNSELQRLSLLVDKVLRLSMFEKHQVDLKTERFDLSQLAEEVMASMRLQFEKAKASVQLHAEGEDLTINADRLHLTSVIFNLLDNALKYSGESPSITVIINRNDKGIQLIVSDNGVGIASAYQKKVFDKFFRVPSGNTHNVKGYGLGLSYVAYVVERHRGSIEVVSEPGEGSSFIIQLPDTL
ncbi:MAG: sensor histidine kinase [Pseudobacter sp.]|uniref:sensor histidine kinase n=1 Tax=Pseudobacter sp. TaxID=2045420 RepID=UPI003F7FD568